MLIMKTRYRVFMAVQVDAGRAPDMLSMLAATGTGKFAASRQKENKFLALLAAHWQRQQQWRRHRPRHADTSKNRTLLLHAPSPGLASTHHQSLEAPLLVFEPRFGLPLACRLSSTPEAEAEAGALQLQHTTAATWRRGCHRQSVWGWCWHMDAPLLFAQITSSRDDTRSLSSLWLLIGYFATPAAGRARGADADGWWRCPLCGLQPKFKYFDCFYDTWWNSIFSKTYLG